MTDRDPATQEQKPETLEDMRAKGIAAARLLEDPLFKEACRQIEAGLSQQRRNVPMRDTEMHTQLIVAEQTWGQILDYVRMSLKTGQWAAFELQRRESRGAALVRRMRAPLRGY